MQASDWQPFDHTGRRKYLSEAETARFLDMARTLPAEGFALCMVLAYTGCRISEALALTRGQVEDGQVRFRTLKRRKIIFRMVPVPDAMVDLLLALPVPQGDPERFWSAHRTTAFRWVKRAMRFAAIGGPQACPKGLRHRFGMRCTAEGIPANLTQRWLGHASPTTTAIYLDAVGHEERRFAAKLWGNA